MEGKTTSATKPQVRPGKCSPQDWPCSPWLEISATTGGLPGRDGCVAAGLRGAAGACGHDLPHVPRPQGEVRRPGQRLQAGRLFQGGPGQEGHPRQGAEGEGIVRQESPG